MDAAQVILVDVHDRPTGVMDKMEAHQRGLLHRAFSVFIFNSSGDMLLQQRAEAKYHSGGLWTNACCSHPLPGEETAAAAQRRMMEELGFTTEINKLFDFVYRADFGNGLSEHEFDHVFAGEYEGQINTDPAEVMDYCYKPIAVLRQELLDNPGRYTAWFRLAFPKLESWWEERYAGKSGNHRVA